MADSEVVRLASTYFDHLLAILRACRRVREILAGQPIPSFGRVIDPAHPRTLTPNQIEELRETFLDQRLHQDVLESLDARILETILPIATSVNHGAPIRYGQNRASSHVEAAIIVTGFEIPVAPSESLLPELDLYGGVMDSVLEMIHSPPWPVMYECPLIAGSAVPAPPGPARVQRFAALFDLLLRGVEDERQAVVAYLAGATPVKTPSSLVLQS
jgi:hypothetical protein